MLEDGAVASADLTCHLEAGPNAPGEARAALESLSPCLEPRLLDDLRLVVSELVTNSVRHGPSAPIRMRLKIGGRREVYGEVVDQGDGKVEVREAGRDGGGLGLRIVETLADEWGVYDGSTHVWFVLRC
jgi:anti-sigma regulatory factor (Ser/Thr protein kinase)